jgi:hypothetical protein
MCKRLEANADDAINRVPMICPFIGGTFGGFLYDLLIFTGESPINTPFLGLKRIVRPTRQGVKEAVNGKPEKPV